MISSPLILAVLEPFRPEFDPRTWTRAIALVLGTILARGYFCCSSGNVTDQVVAEYIANQGESGPEDFRVEHGDF